MMRYRVEIAIDISIARLAEPRISRRTGWSGSSLWCCIVVYRVLSVHFSGVYSLGTLTLDEYRDPA